MREMARRLNIAPNSYTHYENPSRFKDAYLPMEWAAKFADALEVSGIDRNRVLALAGAAELAGPTTIDARAAGLSPRRYEVLLSLLSDLEVAEAADRERLERGVDDAN